MTYCTLGREIIVPLAFCDLCGKICVANPKWMKRLSAIVPKPGARRGAEQRGNSLLRQHHCNSCADPIKHRYERGDWS